MPPNPRDSANKKAKEVARRKKLAERERRRAEFDERREAPEGFVELVRAAVARIDFRDRSHIEQC